jgi:Asp-tRNA(Asn)/Glu-tRNA(Gln) amidotransferase A subunit family amidase
VLRRRIASPVELTQACLKRIERYNPALNAFIAVTAEQAITAARPMEADGMLSSRRSRRLEILRRCDATRRDSEFSSRRETQV